MSTSSAILVSSRKPSVWERISCSRLLASSWFVPTLLLVVLFLLRLPSSLIPREVGWDESQALANAMKFLTDPRPFIAVDGGSWGPLNSYLISIFLLMGFKAGYVLVHMLATGLVCLQVLMAYLTLRRIGSLKSAALVGFVLVAFYGLATYPNFLDYSGELLPSVLLMAGLYAFVVWLDDVPTRSRSAELLLLFLASLLLGTAPWCKLQAAPITAGLGLVIAVAIFLYRGRPMNFAHTAAELLAFALGSVLTTCTMLAILVATGGMKDFWFSYVRGNVAYARSPNVGNGLIHVLVMLLMTPLLQFLVVGLCVLVYAALTGERLVLSRKQLWALRGILVYTAAAMISIGRVYYSFFHHALFLVPPLACLAASITCCLPNGARNSGKATNALLTVMLCGLAAFYSLYTVRYIQLVRTIRSFSYSLPESTVRIPRPPSQLVVNATHLSDWVDRDSNERIAAVVGDLQKAYPIRSLEVWGWVPAVYVLRGIPPTTREAVVSPTPGLMDYYFRPRFLGELRRNPPDLFIDAVVPDVMFHEWNQDEGYETDSALKDFIDHNYRLVDTLTLIEGAKPVRFFIRHAPS